MSAIPLRPVLTFAVGITGHRSNKLSGGSAQRAESQLANVFSAIDAACASRLDQDASRYAEVTYRVRLVSSFAEGADQAAVRVRPRHWEVSAVLPFPRQRYEQDFLAKGSNSEVTPDQRETFRRLLREADAVVEFAEWCEGAPEAYAQAGSFMLGQIDLLVAVWDGAESAGRGGTAETVAQALDAGIPVLWIPTKLDQAPALLKNMLDVVRQVPATEPADQSIADIVNGALAIDTAAGHHLDSFLSEPRRRYCGWTAYDALMRLPQFWTWRWRIPARGLAEISKEWKSFATQAPQAGSLSKRVEEVLLPRFVAADALATHFSHAYRSAYVIGYLFATIAVAIALIGALPVGARYSNVEAAVNFKALLVAAELVLIVAVIVIVGVGHKNRWHQRWLDYRALAETLRHLRFLALIGDCGHFQIPLGREGRGFEWVRWYLRATIRELGCPTAIVDAAYQRELLEATERFEVDAQISYHAHNRDQLRHLHHKLMQIGDICFISTGAILAAYLALYLAGLVAGAAPQEIARIHKPIMHVLFSAKPLMTFLAAFLPTLGAAVAGIRFMGDFDGFADQSAQTALALATLKPSYSLALEQPDFGRTTSVLLETAHRMAVDLRGWKWLFGSKGLTLPT